MKILRTPGAVRGYEIRVTTALGREGRKVGLIPQVRRPCAGKLNGIHINQFAVLEADVASSKELF